MKTRVCLQNVYTGGVQCVQFVHSESLLGQTVSHPGAAPIAPIPRLRWSLCAGADLGRRRQEEEEDVEKDVSPTLLRCIGHVTNTGHLVGCGPTQFTDKMCYFIITGHFSVII